MMPLPAPRIDPNRTLATLPIFQGVSADTVDRLVHNAVVSHLRAREKIAAEVIANCVLLVTRGVLLALLGNQEHTSLLEILTPGDVFESPRLAELDFAARAETRRQTVLYLFNREVFAEAMASDPRLASNLAAMLQQRLSDSYQLRAELACLPARERLLRLLRRLAKAEGKETPEGWILERCPLQDLLGLMVAASRETMSREFRHLTEAGQITRLRGRRGGDILVTYPPSPGGN